MEHKPHREPEIFHLSVARTDEVLTLVRKDDYDGLIEQLDVARVALDRGAADYVGLLEQLETALARAEAAEAFIVQMDMSYRYEEFRERHASSPATGHGTIGPWKYDEGRDVLEAQAEVQFPATRYGGLTREEWAEYLSTKGDSVPAKERS